MIVLLTSEGSGPPQVAYSCVDEKPEGSDILLKRMVGASGFEPPTSWSRTRRSSQAEPRPEGETAGTEDPCAEDFSIAYFGERHSADPPFRAVRRPYVVNMCLGNGVFGSAFRLIHRALRKRSPH